MMFLQIICLIQKIFPAEEQPGYYLIHGRPIGINFENPSNEVVIKRPNPDTIEVYATSSQQEPEVFVYSERAREHIVDREAREAREPTNSAIPTTGTWHVRSDGRAAYEPTPDDIINSPQFYGPIDDYSYNRILEEARQRMRESASLTEEQLAYKQAEQQETLHGEAHHDYNAPMAKYDTSGQPIHYNWNTPDSRIPNMIRATPADYNPLLAGQNSYYDQTKPMSFRLNGIPNSTESEFELESPQAAIGVLETTQTDQTKPQAAVVESGKKGKKSKDNGKSSKSSKKNSKKDKSSVDSTVDSKAKRSDKKKNGGENKRNYVAYFITALSLCAGLSII